MIESAKVLKIYHCRSKKTAKRKQSSKSHIGSNETKKQFSKIKIQRTEIKKEFTEIKKEKEHNKGSIRNNFIPLHFY